MEQKYTSKDTSIRQISAVYNNFDFKEYSMILDIGCGKYYMDTIEEMSKRKCVACGYDPYNQTIGENLLSLSMFQNQYPDYVVCSNVLNVIKEDECAETVIQMIDKYSDVNTQIIISVYQKDRTGIGKETSKGWQRNEKTKSYIPMIEKYLNVDKIKGDFILCSKKTA